MHLKRGVRIGRPFGIPLVVHGSWFPAAALLVSHFALTVYSGRSGLESVALGTVSALAFFASLVAHELGHALLARSMGIPVLDITLFVFGGVARIGREPSRPGQEIAIALAGPVVSAVIGAAGLAAAGSGTAGEVIWTIGMANVALALFNLLPGFPLDGGRILRAVLWIRWRNPHRAALAAGRSGQLLGVLLACTGAALFAATRGAAESLWVGVVGAFLYVLATASRRAARVAARLGSQPAGTWARPFAGTLSADATVSQLNPDGGAPYAVTREGRLAGVLLPSSVNGGRPARAADVMVPWTPSLAFPAGEPMNRALERLAVESSGLLIVVNEAGAVVGVLDHAGVSARLRPRRR